MDSLGSPLVKFADIHRRKLVDILSQDTVMQGLAVETCTVTLGTHGSGRELLYPLLLGSGRLSIVFAEKIFYQPVIGKEHIGLLKNGGLHLDTLSATVEYLLDDILIHLFNRSLQRVFITGKHCLYLTEDERILIVTQRHNSSFVYREGLVGDKFVDIELGHMPQSLTFGAGPLW